MAGQVHDGAGQDKYLVLLDMNGTVCFRSEEPVRGVREDLYVRRKYFYRRLGIDTFVKGLCNSGMFDVVVYTSMMGHNVEAGLNAVLPAYRSLLKSGCPILDRSMNKPDPEGENEWDTVRDMDKVWRRIPGYGPERTLLLDNETRKFKDTPDNGIVVPEFGAAEVKARKSNTLNDLLQYLLELADAAPSDVRAYMRQHRFTPGRAGRPAVTPRPATGLVQTWLADTLGQLSLDASRPGAGAGAGAGGSMSTASTSTASTAAAGAAGGAAGAQTPSSPSRAEGGTAATAAAEAPAGPEPAAEGSSEPVASAAADGDGDGAELLLSSVPGGTRLLLVCIDGGEFVFSGVCGNNKKTKIYVRGPAGKEGLRVEAKMDAHRLAQEARAAGVPLTVTLEQV